MNRGGNPAEEYMAMKVQLVIQTSLMTSCFSDCVSSYKDSTLAVGEQKCIQNCAMRHMSAVQSMEQIGSQM